MKAYLLVFNPIDARREDVRDMIDRIPDVINWHAFFGNTMCLASELGAKELASRINVSMPGLIYFLTEVEPDHKGGRIPESVYRFLNAPGPVQVEA